MYLKALEMRGFKSFPDKTRLDFEKGITAIVGPNGSGKSNISDAVRWVLGEMSPKSLRGGKMEDVIFSGTQSRAQTGFCEVSIIIDNSDFEIDCEYAEIKVTRKYFRSGDSEYRINDKNCRLKDIYELFLNSGIGREGYSVIGQGKISEVISQKSEERRHIFEEAAGISKFRYRKIESEKKLAETDANLLRLADIVTEVESRLGPLEKQAENAKKYLVLADRKRELEVSIFVDKITNFAKESEKYSTRLENARAQYESKQKELSENESMTEEFFAKKQSLSYAANEQREKLSALDEERNEIKSLLAISENDTTHYNERISVLEAEKTLLSQNKQEMLVSVSENENNVRQKQDLSQSAQDKVSSLEASVEKLYIDLCDAEKDFRSAGILKSSLDEELVNLKISTSAAENAEESEKQKREFLLAQVEKINEETEKSEEEKKNAMQRREMILSEKEELSESLAEEKSNLEDIIARHDEAAKEKNEASALLSSLKSKKDTLERMDKLLEGFPGSVKSIMNSGSLSGICGPVSKLLTVSGKYVTAIETALGASVTNIVVENEQSAKAAIMYLKENHSGRATFLPLTSIKGNVIAEQDLKNQKGYIGIGSDIVKYEPKYENIARYLLGRTIVADNIDNASDIAKKYSYRYRVATLDGQLVNAGGSYTGGSLAQKTGVMSRSSDIEELEKQIGLIEEKIISLSDTLVQISEEKAETVQYIEAIENDLQNVAASLYKCEGEIELYDGRVSQCKQRISATLSQIGDGDMGAQRIAELLQKKEETQLRQKAAVESLEKAQELYKNTQDKYESEKESLAGARLELLSANKDCEGAKNALSDVEKRLLEVSSKIDACVREANEIREKLANISDVLKNGSTRLETLEKESMELRGTLEGKISESEGLEAKLTKLRNDQKDLLRDSEIFFKELTKSEAAFEECKKEYDNVTAKLFEEYELTYSEAVALGLPKPDVTFAAELASVKAKIRALGVVNVNAVEEYTETKTRYEFLTKQISDLENSKSSLENIIKRLEKDMRDMFLEAFEKIRVHFSEIFVELFGGGRANIVLTDEENVLESGIEIIVQPPGKMVKSISLLSGGEQAFTAIALYFAILMVNPAPFYIFDEIEAALDDVNVARFGEYLKKHSSSTQFIVITHRRGSMEVADRLYGVTMQQKGISNFLKIDIDEVEKKTGLKL